MTDYVKSSQQNWEYFKNEYTSHTDEESSKKDYEESDIFFQMIVDDYQTFQNFKLDCQKIIFHLIAIFHKTVKKEYTSLVNSLRVELRKNIKGDPVPKDENKTQEQLR